jgi:hypothetical protein
MHSDGAKNYWLFEPHQWVLMKSHWRNWRERG